MSLTKYPAYLLISLDGNGDIQAQDDLSADAVKEQLSGADLDAFSSWHGSVQAADYIQSNNYVIIRRNG